MKQLIFIWITIFMCHSVIGQERIVQNPEFDAKISSMIDFSIPVISVQKLKKIQEKVIVFDVRDRKEFMISHIQNAKLLGYPKINHKELALLDKEKDTLVLYCSIGYRSEKAGEKLKALGFKNIYNLYGSIFEWTNMDFPLVDPKGNQTNQLHVYSKSWGVWVTNPKIKKVTK